MMLCLVAIAANASKTVYFQPNSNWAGNTTRYSLYLFTGENAGPWLDFAAVGETGVYSTTISDEQESWESMIIVAMNPNTTGNSWDDKYNQTVNLAAAPATGLLYTANNDGNNNEGWENITCAVSIYGATAASFTDGGKYLFKNVGSGRYLGPGNDWGTQASLLAQSHYNTIHLADGKYTIESQVSNGGTAYYFTGSYMDGGAANVTITQVAEGVYNMSNGTAAFYGYDGSSTVLATLADPTSDNAKWQIVSYEDALKDATMENPVDATFMILDQNFDRNNRNGGGANNDLGNKWTMVASNQNLCGGTNENKCAESWQSSFTLSQTITVPNGYYKIRAQAACWEYDVTGADYPVVYADEVTIPFNKMTDDSGGMNGFSTRFTNDEYFTDWSDIVTVKNKQITVGVKGTRTNTWCIWDNIQLQYFGPLDLSGLIDAYETALATAKEKVSLHMSNTALAGLNTAIETYDTGKVDETEQSALETATEALNTAIDNANASIASYASLLAAISNASNHTQYAPVFEGATTIYTNAISTAQGVYDAAEVDDCAAAITALTNGIYAAYEADYNTFATDYEYDYSTLLSSDLTQWATTNYAVMSGTEHWNGGTGQRYYEQSSAEWGSQSWSKNASETASLPAGKYVMSITARASADVTQTMSVKIGNNDAVSVVLPHKGSVGRGVTTSGVGSFADGTYANNNNGRGWEYRFIAFELAEESSVTISFNSSTDKQYNWCSIAAPLLKGNVHPNQIKLNQVHSLKATLEGYEGSISAETYATFADNLAAAAAATLESTNLDDIIAALQADIETAKAEKAAFDRGAAMNALNTGDNSVVLTDEATRDNWTPAPELNTWSTEADETGMVTPFLQNWKNKNDGALADNIIAYAPIRGLNKGYYEVSALVRIYSESGAEPSADYATFTANGTSVSLLDGTNFEYNNMKGIYKTVRVVVNTEDALNIYLSYGGANFNWIAWKDLKVTYLTENAAPVYAIAGSASFLSGSWDQATQTDILEGSEGVYSKTYSDVTLDAQTIEYKVFKKDLVKATHATDWYDNNTGNNQTISIPLKGVYDITFTFTEEGSVVSGEATMVAEIMNVGEAGWATAITRNALDFTGNENIKAYTATVENNVVTLHEVGQVPANTPLVLNGETASVSIIASANAVENDLQGSNEYDFNINDDMDAQFNFYGLTVKEENETKTAQFVKLNKGTIQPGKAYLKLGKSVTAHELSVVFEENVPTGIDASLMNSDAKNGQVYNLNGQRVNAPAKGLFIINGKKVVVK